MIPYLPHILPLSAIRSNWIIMDDKRTFLAIALAIAVLLAWTPLAEHMGWIQPQQRPAATQEATPAPAPAAQTAVAPASSLPVFTPSAGTDVKVETPLYSAVIYSGGGILRSFTLKHYDETIKADSPRVNLISPEASQTAPLGLTVNGQPSWSTGQWSFQGSDLNLKAGEQGSLTFTGIVDGVRVTRRPAPFASALRSPPRRSATASMTPPASRGTPTKVSRKKRAPARSPKRASSNRASSTGPAS